MFNCPDIIEANRRVRQKNAMQFELDRQSRQPIYRQLANKIQQRIQNGDLPAGTRLPTVRRLAQQLGVTRLTVHSAYAELQAGGWIEATVGRGTFVAHRIEKMLAPVRASLGKDVSPAGMLADMINMAGLPGLNSLARADAAPELFPIMQWQRACETAIAGDGPALFSYASPQGDIQLRSVLAESLRERGISTAPDEIIVTSGVSMGLSLVARLLARPGNAVLVEQPTYLGLLDILASHQLRPVTVPMDGEGLLIAELEQCIRRERPAFLYTIPCFQNPTGICQSTERRERLLAIAARYELPVIEDDIYGMLSYDGPPPPALKATDHRGQVIYLSSFSKNFMPGLRLGYVVATPAYIRQLVRARQAVDICSPPHIQRSMACFIEQGGLHNHLRRTLPYYRERRDALLHALRRFFPGEANWTQPGGGFSCWVSLPGDVAVPDLLHQSIDRGVAFAPGDVFYGNGTPGPHIRLCFGSEAPERISDAVAILGSLLRETRRRTMALPRTDYIPLV
jgi:DNA-binding transcriptional MocR family regulator